jgi:hypothetical protein
MATLGDFLVELSKPNAEVTRFAQQAAAGRRGLEAVRAVYEAVMQRIKGPGPRCPPGPASPWPRGAAAG